MLTTASWFDVLGDRPPDAIWGIGAKTTAKLATLGITTVRQLADADPQRLAKEFGPMTGPWLVLLGNGRGESEVDPTPYVPRSHGREVTFQRNLTDWTEVAGEVARLARQVAAEVTGRPVARVVVKVRYAPFVTITHGTSLPPGERFPRALACPPANNCPLATRQRTPKPRMTGSGGPPRSNEPPRAALATFTPGRPVRLGVRAEFADVPEESDSYSGAFPQPRTTNDVGWMYTLWRVHPSNVFKAHCRWQAGGLSAHTDAPRTD